MDKGGSHEDIKQFVTNHWDFVRKFVHPDDSKPPFTTQTGRTFSGMLEDMFRAKKSEAQSVLLVVTDADVLQNAMYHSVLDVIAHFMHRVQSAEEAVERAYFLWDARRHVQGEEV